MVAALISGRKNILLLIKKKLFPLYLIMLVIFVIYLFYRVYYVALVLKFVFRDRGATLGLNDLLSLIYSKKKRGGGTTYYGEIIEQHFLHVHNLQMVCLKCLQL